MPDQPSSPLAGEVARIIRLADASSFAGSMGKMFLGFFICIGAGILLATFLCSILYSFFGTTLLGWFGWFWLYIFVLVPLMIWYERKSRHDHLLVAVSNVDADSATTGGAQLSVIIATIASFFVWGPRALIDGLRGMFGRRTVLQSAVLDRAVLIVLELNVSTSRMEIKKLIVPPEDMKIFAQAIDMLLALDLAGRSQDGASMWLISTFRQKLLNFSITHHG